MRRVSIEIPETLYRRLESLASRLGAGSVYELAVDILREGVSRLEEDLDSGQEFSEEEVERIRERLRSLGYLD